MKKITLLVLSAALVAAAACSVKEDPIIEEVPTATESKVVTLVATLSPKDGDATKALTEDGTSIHAAWSVNDKLLVKYLTGIYGNPGQATGTVTAVDGAGNATISVDLDEPTEGDNPISFHYPYTAFTGQKLIGTDQLGTLENISEYYDLTSGSGTLSVTSGTPTLPASVSMAHDVCIWKLAFQDGGSDITSDITSLTISDGAGNDYTITPPAGAKTAIWVAMAGVSGKTITISATTATKLYRYEKNSVTLANGTFYRSTVPMMDASAAATYRVYSETGTYSDVVIPSGATVLTDSDTDVDWDAGTYVVNSGVTIDGNVTLAGNVSLILCDGAELTVNGFFDNPQDAEYNYTYSMNICGQAGGTGRLTIVKDQINCMVHNLNMHGGIVTVTDGGVMQGIETTGRFNMYHGTINTAGAYGGIISLGNMFVYGGSVTATSSDSDGIYANHNITISGGSVTATSTSSYGILVNGSLLTVSGGVMTATGSMAGLYASENATISGGNVTVTATSGFGIEMAGGVLTVNGGVTTATGGPDAVGIRISPPFASLSLGTGIVLYEGDSANPTTPAANQTKCTKRYAIVK